ncbi:MAM and LDL-receptor class A domain-containing protein 1-like [Penaeus monodon]|uniref:MAM and LDL-receptor class A domain-containing protein 1-like n=1 Tax=Penaeus monodon TaxID=6687 RepID=UPI0018A6E4B6|nr:MAM and LDL-receptor class A domain-containing protein 1-like [Penaeus monodon]
MNAEGVVAIDTMVAERGPCSETLSDCDFELGMCGWKDDGSFPLEWVRVQAMNGAPLIAYDHTTNTETGHYMFPRLRANRGREDTMTGILVSPTLTPGGGKQCLTFWYNIQGMEKSTLSILRREGPDYTVLWNRTDEQGYGWVLGRADVNIGESFIELGIKAEYSEDTGGYIVVDDVSLDPGRCPSSSISCNFDEGLCGWTNKLLRNNIWLVGRGYTGDSNVVSGPLLDHTTEDGLYAYVDFTPFTVQSKLSLVDVSEQMSPTQLSCLSFWYIKYGESGRSGVFTVVMANIHSHDGQVTTLLTLDNNVDERKWTRALINVTNPQNYFQISLNAKKEVPDQFIGVDDLEFTQGDCTQVPTVPPPPAQFVMCDFEAEDLCGFEQSQGDSFDWVRGTSNDHASLPLDHTTNNASGHYMYADTSIWGAGAFTSLFSPQIYDLPEACVAFMYFSTKLDQLQAWLHTEGNPDPISIANFSAPFNGWSGARMTVLAEGGWQVEFRVTVGNDNGFVGIDDVILSPDACPDPVSCDFEDGSCLWQNFGGNSWITERPLNSATS